MNMNQFPMQGIRNFSMFNYSYVHSVLQSLSCLECSKQFISLLSNNLMLNFVNLPMTKAFYNCLNTLMSGFEANSSEIIDAFNNSYKNNALFINSKNVLSNDPYHFLHYSLEFLHIENNKPLNPNFNVQILFNQNLFNQQNDDYMYCLFSGFFQQTQNSFISNYFLNIEKYTYKCMNCGVYYNYGIKKIFRINLDFVRYCRDLSFPLRRGAKIKLDECFLCYCGGNNTQCKNCGNQTNVFKYTKLCCSARVLMIFFQRSQHCFYGDVEILDQFNIGNFYSKSRTLGLNYNSNYSLKACISYCNTGKYFADCYVKNNNMFNGCWYRFMDNQVKYINNPIQEINKYEPQLLIYELNDSYYQQNTFVNNMNNINNMNIMNNWNNLNLFLMNIQNLMNNANFANFKNLLVFNKTEQSFEDAQKQNENIMMYLNKNNPGYLINDFNKENNPINNQIVNFQLRFSIVPEIGDQTFETNLKISAQVNSGFTLEQAIDNFFKKALKKREAIKKFILEGQELNPKSNQTLASLGIDENTIIKAIKADNFDNLNIVSI